MPQNRPAWRHHYIPEFYLKRWSSKTGQLVEFSKPYGNVVKPKRVYPRQTGFIDKLYEIEGEPGLLVNYFENEFFRPVDGRAADVLTKMEGGQSEFGAKERTEWGRFLMSMIFRHPENLDAIKRRLADYLFDIDEKRESEYQKKRRISDPPTLYEALVSEFTNEAMSEPALRLLTSMSNSAAVGGRLINMKWGSISLPFHAPALVTSDRPIYWQHPMDHVECHILMPISPKTIFFAVNNDDMKAALALIDPSILAHRVNVHIVRRAVKFVYGFSDVHTSFVQRLMGVDPEKTIPDFVTDETALQRLRDARRNSRQIIKRN